MSYEFLYVGAHAGEAHWVWVMGNMLMYLVTGAESGGSYFTLPALEQNA